MFRVIQRLKWLKYDLKLLNQKGFNDVKDESRKWKARLDDIQKQLHENPSNSSLTTIEK